MTKLFATLHALLSSDRERGAAAIDMGLAGALLVIVALAVATLFNGHLVRVLE